MFIGRLTKGIKKSQEIFIAGRTVGIGRDKGDVEKDEQGIQMVKGLGQRMAWLLKRLYG
jgi:hypothetical protein